MEHLIDDDKKGILSDVGLLILRVWAGAMMLLLHGWSKLENFEGVAQNFDGMLGLPGTVAAGLTVFTEVFCALLVIVGLGTRVAAIPLVLTMAVATYAHVGMWGDPFSDAELATVFGAIFLMFVFTGPGKFSLDKVISDKLS